MITAKLGVAGKIGLFRSCYLARTARKRVDEFGGTKDGGAGSHSVTDGRGIEIIINKRDFTIGADCATVLELVERAGLGSEIDDYDLFCTSNGRNEPLDPSRPVQLEPGMHFRTVRKSNPYGA